MRLAQDEAVHRSGAGNDDLALFVVELDTHFRFGLFSDSVTCLLQTRMLWLICAAFMIRLLALDGFVIQY